MDKNVFFRQATMRLCGNLDIQTAMKTCIAYFRGIIPVTGISMHLFDHDYACVRTVAHVTNDDKAPTLDKVVALPKQARDMVINEWTKKHLKDVMIFNHSDSDPVAKVMAGLIKNPDSSVMVMRLRMEENRLGVLAIYEGRKNQYTAEHSDLLSLLHDPFAIAMSNALKHEELLDYKNMLVDDVRYLHEELLRISGDELVGKEGGLKNVMNMVRQITEIDTPVLLLGETGTGKEVIANVIHYTSRRKQGPFIKVNCGAIPENLVDSELFGHEKGAFTGAITQKRGRFERAHNGTILLDEIGELPLNAQIRLLRVLQTKEIERVGGTTSIPVDVRVISATHRNLEDMVNFGKFREDLWFRLNVFPIMIPPLRQRKEDIPALITHFIERKSKELKIKHDSKQLFESIDELMRYHWPGNVRELENVIERALIQNKGKHTGLEFSKLACGQKPYKIIDSQEHKNEIVKLDHAIIAHIKRALKVTDGKIDGPGGASELLGVNPSTLRTKMKKFGIKRKSE